MGASKQTEVLVLYCGKPCRLGVLAMLYGCHRNTIFARWARIGKRKVIFPWMFFPEDDWKRVIRALTNNTLDDCLASIARKHQKEWNKLMEQERVNHGIVQEKPVEKPPPVGWAERKYFPGAGTGGSSMSKAGE